MLKFYAYRWKFLQYFSKDKMGISILIQVLLTNQLTFVENKIGVYEQSI